MNSDRWGEVSKLYHAALEREAPERMVFLEHNCRDEEVRKEVQSLLAHELEGERLFENSPWKHNLRAATSGEFGPALAAGMRLGPYVIVTPIGAGGMGEVYRARDTQARSRRRLKVLPDGFAQRRRSHGALRSRGAGAGVAESPKHRAHLWAGRVGQRTRAGHGTGGRCRRWRSGSVGSRCRWKKPCRSRTDR